MRNNLNTFIPAAGDGSRMYPHSKVVQKPLLPMGNDKRLIDFSLKVASQTARTSVMIPNDERRSEISDYINRDYKGINEVKNPDGQSGVWALKDVMDDIFPDSYGDILILNGDHFINNLDLEKMFYSHKKIGRAVSILTTKMKDYGSYYMVAGEKVSSTEIYMINNAHLRDAISSLDENNTQNDKFITNVIQPLKINKDINIHYDKDLKWEDCETPNRYFRANMALSNDENVIDENCNLISSGNMKRSVVIGKGDIDLGEDHSNSIISIGKKCLNITKIRSEYED